MKTIFKILMVSAVCGSLYGCIVPPENDDYQEPGRQHHKDYNTDAGNHNYYVTHDGITLPPCDEIPDASQADNGKRCWFE
ncbi:hypothetical protein [Citrobacter sp. Res13-Sevr-PEB04-36]|uniref:hypothetical protein n=1 Tax=Citrobacter sp. Res13-Sevr-PEB04-36 TaxID=2777960 RepID=UPI0018AC9406|nr:hypothetical protein [Citrobacter sp. Res13-Sevr-PEB04-36]